MGRLPSRLVQRAVLLPAFKRLLSSTIALPPHGSKSRAREPRGEVIEGLGRVQEKRAERALENIRAARLAIRTPAELSEVDGA